MTEPEILGWIKKNNLASAPYDGVIKTGIVDGYDIYEINYLPDEDGNFPYIGLPSFILAKDREIKEVSGEEAFEIIDRLEEQKDEIAGETLIL
ncbi:MAG: hypothetical protein IKB97_08985 [Bacteroidaceae bacterium]|nr:hypothetical protein [Bacteroidaceae bacterium]